jgi:hypothetical protein
VNTAEFSCARGGAEPQAILQRMQMAGRGIEHGAVEAIGGEPVADFIGPDPSQGVTVAIRPRGVVHPATQRMRFALLDREAQITGPPLALDRMALDTPAQQGDALDGHVPGAACILPRELPFDRAFAVGAEADDHLAAVAPRRTPADALRFEQHHRVAALGEFQRRRHAGIAAADHAHVGRGVLRERRRWRRPDDAGFVIRVLDDAEFFLEQQAGAFI